MILDTRLVLDDARLRTDFVVASGRYPYELTAHRTFEVSSGTWVSLIVDNLGGHAASRSADGITWTGTSRGPMGEMQIRDSETMLSPGRMIMLGQYSLDGRNEPPVEAPRGEAAREPQIAFAQRR